MKDTALATLLSPLLIWQGLQVRRKALILPEAPGDREGQQGAGSEIRLLIVGDSSAAGVGAPSQETALSGQLVANLSEHMSVKWRLIAKTGATTASTLRCLDGLEAAPFDIAVVALGVNDVTRGVAVGTWQKQQMELADILRMKFSVKKIYSSGLPPMGVFPLLPNPLRWVLGQRALRLNNKLQAMVVNRADHTFVELDVPLDVSAMAKDGFHPGPQVYQVWGKMIADKIVLSAPIADHPDAVVRGQ